MSASTDFDRTRGIQWEASDPAASAWVVANAGSGKTHVLTQRVIRLLLSGADPAAILCLTFTKVAAAEMARRIFSMLGSWTTLPEPQLREAITALQGRSPSPVQVREARRLFARALETPGGLKIQTVHAFCERLLHQFPFEANVPGQFAILDDTSAQALIAGARAEVMAAAADAPQSRLGGAVRYLAENASDAEIGKALDCVIAEREAIRRWIERTAAEGGFGSVEDALADLRVKLELTPGDTQASISREICRAASWSRTDCSAFAQAITDALSTAPHATNERALKRLQAILSSADVKAEADARLNFFLHPEKDGIWRGFETSHRFKNHRFGADFGRANEDVLDRFEAESQRLLSLTWKLRAARSYEATEALLVVGDAILQAYNAEKKRSGFLDFSDLIAKTRNLLSRADAASWVLYRLDARIEHILVDEAQDTSPDQWAVVQAIAADFFSGETGRGQRTIFAVGDDKQSIFGFQGAAPHMLADMQRFFARRVADAQARFVERPLYLSFRSTREVLDAVDRVFSGVLQTKVTASTYVAHAAQRHDKPGQVVVMPRFVRAGGTQPEDWTEPFDAPTAAELALAEQIAAEIRGLVGRHLPSGKVVRAGEILILARKRGAFVTAMTRALRAYSIPAAGADRIPVATHIAVMDLLALADVVLLPEDDLQLAACLKSPLLGVSEDELMRLATERGERDLWSALRASPDDCFAAPASRLKAWRSMADQVTPFRFFATVLGPDGGRRAFRERLGGEADDVLDAFLAQALNYEAVEPPSLQGFLRYLRASQSDIKREAEEAGTGVRIMTVHGAKGLEADVVFLADTGAQIVHGSHRAVLVDIGGAGDPAFLWRRALSDATEAQKRADAAADEEAGREYLRLLYVAMTRARDVLYVCGIRGERGEVEGCWYSLVQRALLPQEIERDAGTGELVQTFIWPQPPRAPVAPPSQAIVPPEAEETEPDWLFRQAPSPVLPLQPLRPSRTLAEPDLPGKAQEGERAASNRPAAETAYTAMARGSFVHRLLQILPGRPAETRADFAERVLKRAALQAPGLAEEIWREVEAVLAHPELAAYFGPDARAEVPIVGHVRTDRGLFAVSGQIDRLLRDAAGWRILDFKTNRAVPAAPDGVELAYVRQLALYRRLIQHLEPTVPVAATIVWTAGPNIMPVSPAAMEQALADLGIRATPVA